MIHVSPMGCPSGPLGLGIHPLAGPSWLGSHYLGLLEALSRGALASVNLGDSSLLALLAGVVVCWAPCSIDAFVSHRGFW